MTEENAFSSAWEPLMTAIDREVIARAGYGRPVGIGERPALVLIDFQHAYVGLDQPILDQLDIWPTAGGAVAWQAVRVVQPVLAAARVAAIPVFFTRIAYADSDASPFAAKRGAPEYFALGSLGTKIVDELAPLDTELVVTKPAASAFFGTTFDEQLRALDIDTLIVAGLSTSGCVRSTIVDASARGYRVALVADAVADRIELSHRVTLLDVWMKYGDLVSSDEVLANLEHLDRSRRSR
jgi:nicotinamidase-related amidase